MNARVFVVVIVDRLPPIVRLFALQQRDERLALHVGWNLRAGHLDKCFCVVQVLDQLFDTRAWLRHAGPFTDKRHLERLFVHPAFVIPAVVSDVEALV